MEKNTSDKFSPFFAKEDRFLLPVLFCIPSPFGNGSILKEENLLPRSKFFPLRVYLTRKAKRL